MKAAEKTSTFRRPVPEDLAAAAGIFAAEEMGVRGQSSWGVEETRDWWNASSLDDSWIVEAEGEPVAFGMLTSRPERTICWVSVDPGYNGRGLSTELLVRGERRARELRSTRLSVGMFAGNDAAARLFHELGFRETRLWFVARDGDESSASCAARRTSTAAASWRLSACGSGGGDAGSASRCSDTHSASSTDAACRT